MPAGQYNFECEQGQTFRRVLKLTQRSDPTNLDSEKVPVNLTGYRVAMQVRKDYFDSVVLAELTTENGRVSVVPVDGQITLELTASETQALTRSGLYDIEIISPNDDETRVLEGEFRLNLGVTK
jgi:hypothetical protein